MLWSALLSVRYDKYCTLVSQSKCRYSYILTIDVFKKLLKHFIMHWNLAKNVLEPALVLLEIPLERTRVVWDKNYTLWDNYADLLNNVWGHPLSTYAKLQTFLTPWYAN